ncbi:FliI/YscN family ATPase [Silvibacterium dinghuense]|uniref:FliI/YscN family ATPase n=1 Tax=Silvibacterium dinghuense TaxID=1560006 RepID=A0A4Q1SFN3_9BACT|nr:FliI/YscN family ATPase [Silvibacterium dinghuense]RXS95668.1 FliI/YscN family ATPase [Silvibacterium dinghuense]GGH14806.1 EscN/YscN/HrcN family type III secretion system ATPase [Silvibacterium dinghuense]
MPPLPEGAIGRAPRLLGSYFARLRHAPLLRWSGRISDASGQTVESIGPPCSLGECCEIVDASGHQHLAEVIGFRGNHVLSMTVGSAEGIRYADEISGLGTIPQIEVGDGVIGRVLDALGTPMDDAGWGIGETVTRPLDGLLPRALDRMPIRTPIGTGVRAIDGLLAVGRGQRVGIFGGSGVGKSTLIGMMTRNSDAEIIVVGLVGERGREVREFLEESLGEEGRRRAAVVVSTSDQSPLLRMRAALAATTVAEHFAKQGRHVLLVLDSLTRYAMAAREVGLAAGEPPTAKGYTPSVFHRLARLIERAGQFERGSITGFYTVLMEGDDQQDPLVDAVRSLLDGHVVLSRGLASEGWYPPIEVLDSISRLMPAVTTPAHREAAAAVRRLLAVYARSEDLIRIGAYRAGSDPALDAAVRSRAQIRAYLMQASGERVSRDEAVAALTALAGRL